MNIDIRIPIGLMFLILGAILTVFGLATCFGSGAEIYQRSQGIINLKWGNINLWWGLINLIFAAVMLGLAWRASKREK
jgi:hypothetical protein